MANVCLYCTSNTTPEGPKNGWMYDFDAESTAVNRLYYQTKGTYTDGLWGVRNSELNPPIWQSNNTYYCDYKEGEKEPTIVSDGWSTPFKITGEDGKNGTDGTYQEFIYRQTEKESNRPEIPESAHSTKGDVPDLWNNHPQGVTPELTCEWMCTRLYNEDTKLWGDWMGVTEGDKSYPALWSKYGRNGTDGDGLEYIFILARYDDNRVKELKITPKEWYKQANEYQKGNCKKWHEQCGDGCACCTEYNDEYVPYDDDTLDMHTSLSYGGFTAEELKTLKELNTKYKASLPASIRDCTPDPYEISDDGKVTVHWSDDPYEVNEIFDYQYVATRKKKTVEVDGQIVSQWQPFSTPILWNRFAFDGDDGTGIQLNGTAPDCTTLKQRVYPEGGKWYYRETTEQTPVEMKNGDSYMIDGDLYVFDGNGTVNDPCDPGGSDSIWTYGGKIQGEKGEKAYLHIKYAKRLSDNGYPRTDNDDLTDDNGESTNGAKFVGYLANYTENGTATGKEPWTSAYSWTKFVGNDGNGTEFIFTRTKTNKAPKLELVTFSGGDGYYWDKPGQTSGPSAQITLDSETYQSSDFIPASGAGINGRGVWHDNPQGVDPEYKYEWQMSRKFVNGKWERFKGTDDDIETASLYSYYGEGVKGDTGKNGRILYPMGEFSLTDWYEMTDTKTPYVYYNGNYWIFNGNNGENSGMTGYDAGEPTTGSTIHWIKADKFKAIFAEMAIIDYGKFGSGVFCKDLFFSQYGYIWAKKDQSREAPYVWKYAGESSGYYQYLYSNDPYFEQGQVSFRNSANNNKPALSVYTLEETSWRWVNTTTQEYSSYIPFKPAWCVNLKTGEMWTSGGAVNFKGNGSGKITDKITWDKDGNIKFDSDVIANSLSTTTLVINGGKTVLRADGGGRMADGKIYWDTLGNLHANNFNAHGLGLNSTVHINAGNVMNYSYIGRKYINDQPTHIIQTIDPAKIGRNTVLYFFDGHTEYKTFFGSDVPKVYSGKYNINEAWEDYWTSMYNCGKYAYEHKDITEELTLEDPVLIGLPYYIVSGSTFGGVNSDVTNPLHRQMIQKAREMVGSTLDIYIVHPEHDLLLIQGVYAAKATSASSHAYEVTEKPFSSSYATKSDHDAATIQYWVNYCYGCDRAASEFKKITLKCVQGYLEQYHNECIVWTFDYPYSKNSYPILLTETKDTLASPYIDDTFGEIKDESEYYFVKLVDLDKTVDYTKESMEALNWFKNIIPNIKNTLDEAVNKRFSYKRSTTGTTGTFKSTEGTGETYTIFEEDQVGHDASVGHYAMLDTYMANNDKTNIWKIFITVKEGTNYTNCQGFIFAIKDA